jgi:hypothetical protein
MNYKDTVIKGSSYGLSPTSTEAIRLEQAKISFEAGAKEVLNWIKGGGKFSKITGYYAITYPELKEKCNEWGIRM